MTKRKIVVSALIVLSAGASVLMAQRVSFSGATQTGPSSSQSPYVQPSASGWQVVSLLTAGDPAEEVPYRMVGLPDGLGALGGKFNDDGAYSADKAYMTVFMNHELATGTAGGNNPGIVRAHGQNGAFVSQWSVHLNTLQVKVGQDQITRVLTWSALAGVYVDSTGATAFSRFCSADLPAATALFNPATGRGFDGRIFMTGEENGVQGRAFAHVLTGVEKGTAYELPALGRFSWENSVAHPNAGDRTIVVGLDDTSSPGGEVYVYVGTKQREGNPVQRAGLAGGTLYGIKVTNGGSHYANSTVPLENAGTIEGAFTLQAVTDPSYVGDGAALQTFSTNNGFTKFARPEDGAWDTRDPRVFYFVVTGGINNQTARLYRLTFAFDAAGAPTGGTIESIVDRAELLPVSPAATAQFDNITVAGDGSVLIQEDPGNTAYLARTWRVRPSLTRANRATEILVSDPARFQPPTTAPFNQDEENSGIIEVTDLVKAANWYESGRRYFLADAQAHYRIAGELVEGGQLYLLASPRED